jgi:FkbM family methyltransferase
MFSIHNNHQNEQIKWLVDKFLTGNIEKYILGLNENSKKLANIVNINGYIDDFSIDKIYNNINIYKSSKILNKEAIIVSSSLAIYPHSAIKSLRKNEFKNILSILEIAKYSDFNLGFISSAKKDLENNLNKYNVVFNFLKDNESKIIFENIINFRFNFDLSYMKSFIVDIEGQYFEDFLNLQRGEVFIDVGGFDGKTSVEFIKRCPNYKSIYIFEPSENNLTKAKENLKNYRNVNFISKGLSNQKDVLKFNADFGSASVISEHGTIILEVDTLDNLINEKVSFIKIDIEGWESMAIEGMRNHILNDHPKIAISVYHKVDDFWKIPEQVFAIRHDYDIYMRHYTEGTDETVMFFMPK